MFDSVGYIEYLTKKKRRKIRRKIHARRKRKERKR